MSDIPALLQPLKDRLAAAHEWDVCDGEQTVRSETGEIIYDRSGYDRSEWVGEYRPIAELIAAAPTDQAKLIAAVEAVVGLPHEDYCCTKGCPGFGLATCGKVHKYGDECDGSECSCFMSGPLRALTQALGGDTA